MNNAFFLFAIASISFCLGQNNSCRDKTTGSGSNSAATTTTATPSTANNMNTDATSRPTAKPTAPGNSKLSGLWGGVHVALEVSDGGATLEFDCATGSIREPIGLDAAGRFDVSGSYTREGPGPVRQGVKRDSPAQYSGTVTGETMALTVRLEGSSEPLDFSLTRGKQGKLRKCY
jgi:hypothetical protein